jgi:hypothetical protein
MESNENLTNNDDHDAEGSGPEINGAIIGWGIVALVLAILMCTFNNSAMVLGASFGAKFLAVIVGSVFGWVGALIGDAIRKFAHPDAVLTQGGMFHLIGIKLFWLCGPQLVGLGLGVALGCSLVLM